MSESTNRNERTMKRIITASLLAISLSACAASEGETDDPTTPMSDEDMRDFAADTTFDSEVEDLLGVSGDTMRPVALEICDNIEDMSEGEFMIYAMAFIDEIESQGDVTGNDAAQFMGLSIGAYCPESGDLIPN